MKIFIHHLYFFSYTIFKKTEKQSFKSLSSEVQIRNPGRETSLVAQSLRIQLPMQGTRVQTMVREDPTCCGATKPVRHNY